MRPNDIHSKQGDRLSMPSQHSQRSGKQDHDDAPRESSDNEHERAVRPGYGKGQEREFGSCPGAFAASAPDGFGTHVGGHEPAIPHGQQDGTYGGLRSGQSFAQPDTWSEVARGDRGKRRQRQGRDDMQCAEAIEKPAPK